MDDEGIGNLKDSPPGVERSGREVPILAAAQPGAGPELLVEPSDRQHDVAAYGHPGADPASPRLGHQRPNEATVVHLVVRDETEARIVGTGDHPTERHGDVLDL